MASLPVTVKVMVPEVDVADVAAKVTVGVVVSMTSALFAPKFSRQTHSKQGGKTLKRRGVTQQPPASPSTTEKG